MESEIVYNTASPPQYLRSPRTIAEMLPVIVYKRLAKLSPVERLFKPIDCMLNLVNTQVIDLTAEVVQKLENILQFKLTSAQRTFIESLMLKQELSPRGKDETLLEHHFKDVIETGLRKTCRSSVKDSRLLELIGFTAELSVMYIGAKPTLSHIPGLLVTWFLEKVAETSAVENWLRMQGGWNKLLQAFEDLLVSTPQAYNYPTQEAPCYRRGEGMTMAKNTLVTVRDMLAYLTYRRCSEYANSLGTPEEVDSAVVCFATTHRDLADASRNPLVIKYEAFEDNNFGPGQREFTSSLLKMENIRASKNVHTNEKVIKKTYKDTVTSILTSPRCNTVNTTRLIEVLEFSSRLAKGILQTYKVGTNTEYLLQRAFRIYDWFGEVLDSNPSIEQWLVQQKGWVGLLDKLEMLSYPNQY